MGFNDEDLLGRLIRIMLHPFCNQTTFLAFLHRLRARAYMLESCHSLS